MANLAAYQKLTRVTGSPFGTGKDGVATISSDLNIRATVTATAGSASCSLGSAILSNGDVFLVHQTQGSGAGNYEFMRVLSGGGTTSIICTNNFTNSYSTGAQAVKFNQYLTATVSAHSVTAWNGSTGGIEVICAKNGITVSGAVNLNGGDGGTGNPGSGGTGGGYRGGTSGNKATPSQGYQGEGTGGGLTATTSAAGSAPGGTYTNDPNAGGGGTGGSHAAQGTSGSGPGGFYTPGTQGSTAGAADLTTLVFGAGGGGAARGANGGNMGGGAAGGGAIIIISKSITLSAGVTANGGTGGANVSDKAGGGGGAGGSILLVGGTVSLGTNNATALAGAGGASPGDTGQKGGDGSVGRIAIHYSGTLSGTTTPAYTGVTDSTLNETGGLLFTAGL